MKNGVVCSNHNECVQVLIIFSGEGKGIPSWYYFYLPIQVTSKINRSKQGCYKVHGDNPDLNNYGLTFLMMLLYLDTKFILVMWDVWAFQERLLSIKTPKNLVTLTY